MKNNEPDKKEKGKRIWVMENGRPVSRAIEIGISDGRITEVISGLKEGEIVLTTEAGEKKGSSSSPIVGRECRCKRFLSFPHAFSGNPASCH